MSSLRQRLETGYGLVRSLAIYHGKPWQRRRVEGFYRRFIGAGDLAFDLGSHVGSRIRAWRRLGARVVAVEPQPALMAVLRRLYGDDPEVALVEAAVAARPGELTLQLNLANPTISTASRAFIAAAAGAPSFAGQSWTAETVVPALTLDALIERHGTPVFVKLDIEGFEAEALAGLTRTLPVLSVEFVPMHREVILACLDRLAALGDYRFNASFGDSMRLEFDAPADLATIRAWIAGLDADGPAGDVYAALDAERLHADPR